jgi:hypothetical protein
MAVLLIRPECNFDSMDCVCLFHLMNPSFLCCPLPLGTSRIHFMPLVSVERILTRVTYQCSAALTVPVIRVDRTDREVVFMAVEHISTKRTPFKQDWL